MRLNPMRHRPAATGIAGTGKALSALSLSLLLALLLAAVAHGQTGRALDERVREIADQLRCPTCQGISVNDSEAAFSRQIRLKVRRMVQEGQSDEQIKAYFVSRYGEWILRAPRKEGLGLVLWITPGLLMALVGGWIIFKVHRGARAGGAAAQSEEPLKAQQPLSAAQRKRIERDLERFEEEG